jgi:hypothetical protein
MFHRLGTLADDTGRMIPTDAPRVSSCIEPTGMLHAIVVLSNPVGYQARYTLMAKALAHLATLRHMTVWLVELAVGHQPHMFTVPGNRHHLQLRAKSVMWHKENMMNLGVEHLTREVPDWKYMAWIDGDIEFNNPDIARATIQKLDVYPIVQMFQTVMNKGPDGAIHDTHYGFAYQYSRNNFRHPGKLHYAFWHPGFAWAYTRDAWRKMGRFIDRGICGAGDHHMALALINMAHLSLPKDVPREYRVMVMDWQDRVWKQFHGMIGYVNGTIIHGWHGRFTDRRYQQRWEIIIQTKFNPWTDLVVNEQGVFEWDLVDSQNHPDPRLPLLMIKYFEERNEDTIECAQVQQ